MDPGWSCVAGAPLAAGTVRARLKEKPALVACRATAGGVRSPGGSGGRVSGAHFCVEAPAQSALWRRRPLVRALDELKSLRVDLAFCQFGAPYRRDTRLATSLPTLGLLARPCLCRGHAANLGGVVEGPDGGAVAKSELGGRYPAELCWAYASVAQCLAPAGAWRRAGERRLRPQWESRLAAAAGEKPRRNAFVAEVWGESVAPRPPGSENGGPKPVERR